MKRTTKIISLLIALSCLITALYVPVASDAAGRAPTKSTVNLVEWHRVRNYSDLPTDNKSKYYMFLAWDHDNGNPDLLTNTSPTAVIMTSNKNGGNIAGEIFADSVYQTAFTFAKDTFITSSAYGMPQMIFESINKNNTNSPQYYIKLNEGKGDYLVNDDDSFKYSSTSGTRFGISPHTSKNAKYEKSAKYDGCVCIFDDIGGDRDSGFLFHGTNLTLEQDMHYDDFDPFILWVGKEVTYSIITTNYTIMPGEVLSIKDRVLIKNGVTLTVAPGGILSVDGTLINNGTIQNYGTLIVEKGCEVFPLVMGTSSIKDSNAVDKSSNTIISYGSKKKVSIAGYSKKLTSEGVVINRGNMTFATNMGSFCFYEGAVLENEGFILCASRLLMQNSQIRSTGKFALGCVLKNPSMVFGYDSTGYPLKIYTGHSTTIIWGIPGLSLSTNNYYMFDCKTDCSKGTVYSGKIKLTWE